MPIGMPGEKTDVTFGFDTFSNLSDADLSITRVDLVNPRGIAVVEIYLVPMLENGGSTAVGVSSEWPPGEWQTEGIPGWNLDNYKSLGMPAHVGGIQATFNLVAHLRLAGGQTASFDSMRITYTSGGETFYQDTINSLAMRKIC